MTFLDVMLPKNKVSLQGKLMQCSRKGYRCDKLANCCIQFGFSKLTLADYVN